MKNDLYSTVAMKVLEGAIERHNERHSLIPRLPFYWWPKKQCSTVKSGRRSCVNCHEMTSLDEVKNAIIALSIPTETLRANQWLVDFEKSNAGWEVADRLLNEAPGSTNRFFGAKFLYSKIQRDFSQLNEGSIPSLTHTIVKHIIRLASESAKLELNVCRYLCLSLAALAVQINQDGVVTQVLQWLNPILVTSPRILLELLVALPEECFNRILDVSSDVRDLFAAQLSRSAAEVFGFLNSLSSPGGASSEVLSVVLKCLAKWIDFIQIPGPLLAAHPVFHYSLDCLAREELFEGAVDVVSATLGKFRCSEDSLLSLTIPRILALRPLWATQVSMLNADSDSSDTAVCRALCRLFTETAESCLDLIRADNNKGLDQLVFQLVQCTQFPYDHTIARIPFAFFQSSENLQLGDFVRQSDKLAETYLPAFAALFDAALVQTVLPTDVIMGTTLVDDETEESRLDWRDIVIDCSHVLTRDVCLERACVALQRELQGTWPTSSSGQTGDSAAVRWDKVESCLFCIEIVVQQMSKQESAVFPQLMACLGSLPNLPGLKTTIISLIGGFSFWLRANGSFLPSLLTQLYSSLQAPVLATTKAAAKAIKSIFKSCGGVHALPIPELHTIILEMRANKTLPLEYDLTILEGMCFVLSALQVPIASKIDSVMFLLDPVLASLSKTLATGAMSAAASVSADVDRLTTCMRQIDIDGSAVADIFLRIQPLLQKVLEVYATSEYICEKVCRCYKYSIRSSRKAFIPLLQPMTVFLSGQFSNNPIAAFLYAGAVCLRDYSREDEGAHVEVLYGMVWSMTSTFFSNMGSLQQFEQRPDVVEEYFYLMAKALQYAPQPFLLSVEGSAALIQAGVTGLQLKHKDAQKGILMFFDSLIQLPAQAGLDSARNAALVLILRAGGPLVMSMCSSLAGQGLPAYALDEDNGCCGDVLWSLRHQCKTEIQVRSQCLY
jgi:transportin-3